RVEKNVPAGKALRREVDGKAVGARRQVRRAARRRVDDDVLRRNLRERRKVRGRDEAALGKLRRPERRRPRRRPLPSADGRRLARVEPLERLLDVAPEITGVVVLYGCHWILIESLSHRVIEPLKKLLSRCGSS